MHESLQLLLGSASEHIQKIEEWFEKINNADGFIRNQEGEILLNAISMRLQALSENLKNIQKKYPDALKKYPQVNWDEIVRFRDLISHHYELLDYQIVYRICEKDIPVLKSTVGIILNDL